MRHFAIPVVAEEQAILDRLSVIADHPLKYQEYLNDRIGFTSHFGHVTDLILPGGIWTAALKETGLPALLLGFPYLENLCLDSAGLDQLDWISGFPFLRVLDIRSNPRLTIIPPSELVQITSE